MLYYTIQIYAMLYLAFKEQAPMHGRKSILIIMSCSSMCVHYILISCLFSFDGVASQRAANAGQRRDPAAGCRPTTPDLTHHCTSTFSRRSAPAKTRLD